MTITERLDRFQRRHPGAGFPLAVVYKFLDDDGYFHAALLTYYGFLAIFPLLLLSSTVLFAAALFALGTAVRLGGLLRSGRRGLLLGACSTLLVGTAGFAALALAG